MEKYKFNAVNGTFTISASFAKAMQNPSSKEYKLVAAVRKDFPSLRIVQKTHASPRKYITSSGEVYACNQFKNLTYKHMEAFMSGLPNSEQYLSAYHFLRDNCGGLQTSAYTVVRRWFVAQFPKYRKDPLMYGENIVKVLDVQPFLAEAKVNQAS